MYYPLSVDISPAFLIIPRDNSSSRIIAYKLRTPLLVCCGTDDRSISSPLHSPRRINSLSIDITITTPASLFKPRNNRDTRTVAYKLRPFLIVCCVTDNCSISCPLHSPRRINSASIYFLTPASHILPRNNCAS